MMKPLHLPPCFPAAIAVIAAAVLVPAANADLVLRLSFDDNVEDQSGNGNDGEILNDAGFGADVPEGLGGGKSLVLENGGGSENQGVRVEGSEDLAADEFTLAYWIKPTTLQGNAGLERLTSRGGDAFETAIGDRNAVGGGDPLTLSYYAGSWQTTGVTVEEGEWSHIAWRQGDAGDLELFVNGENVFTGIGVPPGRINAGQHLNVGTRHNQVEGFEGLMDELRYYNSALSDAEIAELASPAPGLPAFVGVWNFDGDAVDASGNGNDGEVIDAEFSADVPREGGMSLLLENGAHVLVAHAESLNIVDAITIAAWVKPVGGIGWDGVIAKNPSDGSGANHAGNYELRVENGGRFLHFLHQQGGANDTAFHQGLGSVIETDVWTHIAVTAETESGDVSFYINGELSETLEGIIAVDEFPTNENPLYIGSRADLFTGFDGLLDEVVLHNAVLDADQVKHLFTNGLVPPGDADADGCSDSYEEANDLDPNDASDVTLDPDGDGLTNGQECARGTLAQNADSDGDGLKDGVETGTEVWVSAADTGTNPLRADTDRDGLNDGVETNTKVFVSATDTGTSPLSDDSDGDKRKDGNEVASGTNPNDPNDPPPPPKDAVVIGYWPLDEDLRDSSGNNGDGELMDGDDDVPDFVEGKLGNALSLDGIGEFVEINPDNEDLYSGYDPDTGEPREEGFSVTTWFKVGAFEKSWQCLVAKGEGNRWRIHRRGGESTITGNGGNADVSPGVIPVDDDEWHFLALISNPLDDIAQLYVDGELEGESTGLALEDNDNPMMIGENPDARGRTWNGLVDDLAFYNRAITEEEVLQLWNGGDGATVNEVFLGGSSGLPFRITSVVVADNKVTFTWPSSEGQSFVVEQSTSTSDFVWEELTDSHPADPGDSTSYSADIPVGATTLHVRVRKE